ncbi:deoxyguanosinetriphosphate triphosphohydrolase family protein [Megasphaera vaginalis (ex Srinivasan et al. 2021)]|uniref:HD domain protein n=1 Tax=Megasphaera vaginalis (ex Srinivasan et al. 2021) TaxID=1111454 RepID=U7UFH3_9FIRM|nr:HD domain-containing protein [Megasphaera vaginalis (ex Srinivasan et al. 2021)]ERT58152.1 HD domain protein [Megasphaera vaginalis (ex Srinivasan et al. 2021)]
MKGSFASVRMDEQHPHWRQAVARKGRLYRREGDFRTEFGRDYTRIIHSTAYSRLKHKTQVFFTTKNDHISTRIDHVNQVNSVSSTIGQFLGLNTELIGAIAQGHDLGHSPFGHLGERVLREISKKELGETFWHERQGLRVVDSIETLLDPAGRTSNLMLTYAVRDGIISHCGEVRQTVLRPRREALDLDVIRRPNEYEPYTWEGCVVKIADKIAYLGRDIEDAVRLHILKEDGQPLKELLRQLNSHLRMNLQSVTNTAIMYPLVTDICRESTPEKGLVLSASHLQLMDTVMKFNYRHIYRSKRLENYHAYARLILESIYSLLKECYAGDGTLDNLRLLQHDYPTLGRHFLERMYKLSDVGRKTALHDKFGNDFGNAVLYRISSTERDYRIACIDYIAGMTDTYAEKIFVEMTTF